MDRLIRLSGDFPRRSIPLHQIRELDEPWFGEDEPPTWKSLVDHMRLVEQADLSFPIILSAGGAVMDGMHRVARAVLLGHPEINAVQFEIDPEPDHVGKRPEELPYDAA